ncbi:MAG: TM0106 family RecB-like putative nuclease, partial [Candidatus Nanoarchaeia archaeon]
MITASHVYRFCKCPRKIYLDKYGDSSEKCPLPEFVQYIMQKGNDFEAKVVGKIDHDVVEYSDYAEGFEKTLKLLKDGSEEIYHGVLMFDDLLGEPDLLERTREKSDLGAHHYIPVEIKSGLHPKDAYVMQLMFYCFLLEKVQGLLPDECYLILGDESKVKIETKEHYARFLEYFHDIEEILDGKEAPLFICGECKNCEWQRACKGIAVENDDLSLLFRVSRKQKEALQEAGIKDIEDASKIDVASIRSKINPDTLQRIKLQSQSLLTGKLIKLLDPEFPKKTEIYFDIEGETELKIDYLFGLLVV